VIPSDRTLPYRCKKLATRCEVIMKSLLERIRARLTTGLTRAVAWAPVGLIVGGNSQTPDEFPLDELSPLPFGGLGALGGVLLGGILLA
jgi:hypothetical protein